MTKSKLASGYGSPSAVPRSTSKSTRTRSCDCARGGFDPATLETEVLREPRKARATGAADLKSTSRRSRAELGGDGAYLRQQTIDGGIELPARTSRVSLEPGVPLGLQKDVTLLHAGPARAVESSWTTYSCCDSLSAGNSGNVMASRP